MSVYVGVDVHRKRSQVAVVDRAGEVLANRNVPNGVEPILGVIGDLPVGTLRRSRPRSAGAGWSSCSRATASTRTCTNFALGGLNYQIEHHLFPSMPRPNLRRAQPIVRDFCSRGRINYTETSLLGAYRIVVRYLNQVGLGASDPFRCPLVVQYRA